MNEKQILFYRNITHAFEIIKRVQKRECAFIVPSWTPSFLRKSNTRMLTFNNTQGFYFWFKCLHLDGDKFGNFYYTLAKYKNGIPKRDGNLSKSSDELKNWLRNHHKEMESYDYLIDIDADNHNDMDFCLESALTLFELLNACFVPFKLRFSGCGFHFIVPYIYLPNLSLNPNDENNLFMFLARMTDGLFNHVSEMIDKSIYDSRRLCKIPYTLSIYENDTFVCTPINSFEQLKNFNLDDYNLNNYKFYPSCNGCEVVFNNGGNIKILLDFLKLYVSVNAVNGFNYEHEKRNLFNSKGGFKNG